MDKDKRVPIEPLQQAQYLPTDRQAETIANVFGMANPEEREIAHLSPEEQVEYMLDLNASFFRSAEAYWEQATELAIVVTTPTGGSLVQGLERNEQTGKSEQRFTLVPHNNRAGERQHGQTFSMRAMLAIINRYSYDLSQTLNDRADYLYETNPHDDDFCAILARDLTNCITKGFRSGEIEPFSHDAFRLGTSGDQLVRTYVAAFSLQRLATRKIKDMLADDALAPYFIDRFLELAQEGQELATEYPGLLETLATHIATTQNKQPNYIEDALDRLARKAYTEQDFIADILENGPATSEKSHKSFLIEVAAAQMVAGAVQEEFTEIDSPQQRIAQRLAQYLQQPTAAPESSELITAWQEVYNRRLHSRTVNAATDFAKRLSPYHCGGRRRSNIQASPQRNVPSANPRQSKRAKKAANQSHEKQLDVENLITVKDQPLPTFAILNSSGSSNHNYNLHEVGSLDDVMEHPLIAKFIDQYRNIPNMSAAIRYYLEDISYNPFAYRRVVNAPFSLTGSHERPKYLRRFSPSDLRNAESITVTDQLLRRVRIIYGVTSIQKQQKKEHYVALYDISLRDGHTY